MFRRNAWRSMGAPVIAAAVSATLALAALGAANYPNRPVRIVLPFGPGGLADVSTRLVAAKLSERMGQNFFIDNRPGAGGIVAAKEALSFPPDGYTMFLSGNSAAISESLFASLPFDFLYSRASGSVVDWCVSLLRFFP